jgi:hypothetical protein
MKSDINKHVAQLTFIFFTGFISKTVKSCMPKWHKNFTHVVQLCTSNGLGRAYFPFSLLNCIEPIPGLMPPFSV